MIRNIPYEYTVDRYKTKGMWAYRCADEIGEQLDDLKEMLKIHERKGEWVNFDELELLPEMIADLILALDLYCYSDGVTGTCVNRVIDRRIAGDDSKYKRCGF
jgi:hypothetical protein